MNPYSEFSCLYTSQKQKKTKTWQDGHIRYFHNNSKVVLYDGKFAVLDSSFHRGPKIEEGDDLDMDRHLVEIEKLTLAYATNSNDQLKPAARPKTPSGTIVVEPTTVIPPRVTRPVASDSTVPATTSSASSYRDMPTANAIPTPFKNTPQAKTPNPEAKRKKWRPPFSDKENQAPSNQDDDIPDTDLQLLDSDFDSGTEFNNHSTSVANNGVQEQLSVAPTRGSLPVPPAPKRRKVGLSRGPSAANVHPGQITLNSPHRPPSTQLEFPNAARCTNFTGKNSSQLLRRTMSLGSRFTSTNQYKDGLAFLIYEHLQILVIEIAMSLWNVKNNGNTRDEDAFDGLYRSRGIHMHSGSSLRRRGDAYSGFPMYTGWNDVPGSGSGSGQPSGVSVSAQQGAVLTISNKEHHSKYSKDDLWVVSKSPRFEASSTFFARSVFYGPSGSDIEITCLSTKDSNTARDMFAHTTNVCAVRLFNAMSEFMMLDNLEDLTRTPVLPVILNYVPPALIKASKTSVFKAPSRIPEKSGCVVLTEDDGINVEMEIRDTVDKYHLNEGQAAFLRNFAATVIRAPGWGEKSDPPPILLVHGVFGAGKSFLIAVLIVFMNDILSKARPLPREERSCRFLVTSMTNVAVDRILMALLDLDYTNFVRVGSLKKVARRVLPFTAQSNTSRGEDIKELQSILDDDSISHSERRYVKEAIKRFTKHENRGIVGGADVVGVTCVAAMFEALDDATFPIVILDEASQLLEPMSLIPICRAAGEKLILVGDPLQLSPPLNTNSDNSGTSKGLSRTLFDRAMEMGIKPVMLKTQYRCHHRIANISSSLFYSNSLQTGTSPADRAPMIQGLPTLTFIDSPGQEIQNSRTKSFTNPSEVKLVVKMVQRLLVLNVPDTSIGVISLYKSQADSIESELSESLRNTGRTGTVQISTVDAFQGSEKDIVIVSTVRTDSIGFADNHQRVNVALTRSKRHLFIVGNSRLLSSNRLWGSVMKDHCGAEPDGIMQGEDFAQRLRSLTPLPRQAAVPQLQEPDSEEEEEEEEEEKEHDDVRPFSHFVDHHDEEEEEDDDDSYYVATTLETKSSELVPTQAPVARPRSYALYAADEEDESEGSEEEPLRNPHRDQLSRNSSANSATTAFPMTTTAHKSRSPYVPGNTEQAPPELMEQKHDQAKSAPVQLYGQARPAPMQLYGQARPPLEKIFGQAKPVPERKLHGQAKPAPQARYGQSKPISAPATDALGTTLSEEDIVPPTLLSLDQRHGYGHPDQAEHQDNRISRSSSAVLEFSAEVKKEPQSRHEAPVSHSAPEEPEKPGAEIEEELIWEEEDDEENVVEKVGAKEAATVSLLPHGSLATSDQEEAVARTMTSATATAVVAAHTTASNSVYESQRVEDLQVEGWSQLPGNGNVVSPVSVTGSTARSIVPSVPSEDKSFSVGARLGTRNEGHHGEDDDDDILCLEVGDLCGF